VRTAVLQVSVVEGSIKIYMKHIQPTQFIPNNLGCVFLAGSIEMGVAELWQDRVVDGLSDTGWVILNPRRSDWDSTWEQKISNPKFYEQVNWELQGIEQAEFIIVYFDPNTKSPISLMELGYIAGSAPEKAIVVCPEGFWRKGNVDIMCDRYRMKQVKTIDEAISVLRSTLL
jgi:Nucleoside 2-deoxyribosyltransferase like